MSEHIESTRGYFNELAPRWDSMKIHDAGKIEAILTLIGVCAGQRILDIGCGTGVLFGPLLSRGVESVLGIDLAEGMIACACEKFCDPRIEARAADIFRVQDGGFDQAVIYSAYPHFTDPTSLLAHVAGRLRPGGRLTVAHSDSRYIINHRHDQGAQQVSDVLAAAHIERQRWEPLYSVDIQVDTDAFYILSGTLRG